MTEAQGPHLPFIRRLLDTSHDAGAVPAPGASTPGVLVIDREEAVRAALFGWLRQQGFVVWTAADQEEALTLYRKHGGAISLVVEDLRTYWLPPRDLSRRC
jgi:hypothetical protein